MKDNRSAILIEGGDVETIFKKHTNNIQKINLKVVKSQLIKVILATSLVNAGWDKNQH